ncbi:DsbC family protein [Pseudothauera nasutitermitis]|uniref:Thiol:disulfide interchange protein n=1 Tax=Pseudothauera nasutitermitis TaxID=2565930 RepID=A0A4S4AX21_9RHOO|nr:DsbC family protein [Pseudothauera nasutitermitis]THF63835.1 DsbC family protein [Pseudothauera nasutitermitis]
MQHALFRPAVLAAALFASTLAHASNDAVKAGVETFLGSPVVESVTATPYGGLYEVVLTSGELVYTDAKVGFIIDGNIIDAKLRRDVTRERLNELAAIDFGTLPLDQAIKQVKGDGKRVLVSFEDPNCGYCKRLGKDLAKMDDVTIYTFLYPILSPDSVEKSRNIWCAKDRAQAWNDWIVDGKTPAQAECDSSVVDRNVAFGQQLRISGTPTMFLADGSRIGGYLPPAELERLLAAASAR